MFYSQMLLSKKGALGIVWMAAHCHRRLKKDQVHQTNISSSVDKILDDEVPVVTHRILAFLLLGVVRIYSKKVEYLFHDCHEILNRLCGFKTGKSTPAGIRVSRTHYHSITLPTRFELDEFDLELLEDQNLVGENVRSREQDLLADGLQKDGSTSGSRYKHKETKQFSEAYSTAHTPPRDVFSPHQESPSSNMNISLGGLEGLRGTRFSLEDRLEPFVLDESEQDQMHNKLSNRDPRVEMRRGTGFSLEDRLDPMVLGDAEKEQPNDRSSNENISLGIHHQSGFSLEHSPSFQMFNEAEKGQHHGEPSDKDHDIEEEHLKTRLNFQEDDAPLDLNGSVDKTVAAEKMKFLKVIIAESVKRDRREDFPMSTVTPDSKLPGVGTPEVAIVRTPAAKERPKILKKRKALFDLVTVVPNKVFKKWVEEEPSGLNRERRKVPHTLLHVWRARKLGNMPQSFFEPLIPGISMDLAYLECEKSCAAAVKSMKLSPSQDNVESPVSHGVQEQTPDIQSPVIQRSPEKTPIAPGTPVNNLNSLRSNEAREVADSDIMEPTTSSETIEKWPSLSETVEFDAMFQEETSSFEEDGLGKDTYSARTRMSGRYLGRKLLDKKRRKEEQVLNLSQLLTGKTKKESARLFYEILVLKTRDCIDVQQENAYDDILLRGTSKLKKAFQN